MMSHILDNTCMDADKGVRTLNNPKKKEMEMEMERSRNRNCSIFKISAWQKEITKTKGKGEAKKKNFLSYNYILFLNFHKHTPENHNI